MPRRFGGTSPLGAMLNEMGSRQEGQRVARPRRKFGIIKEVVGRQSQQGVYVVILEIIGPDGKPQGRTGPIPLQEHPTFLAANYGAPEDLVERFVCRVDYMGTSVNRGLATIVRPLTNDKEITEQTNQVQVTGAAFAPPGGSLV